ncbi:hypothetical protein MMC07_003951 [Pseudocyphellaria aurata]|nr:hypothetical protein [Pseudocyphellaria aurata]
MPPPSASLFSPPHLSYLHSSLSLTPPIRPDARAPTSFRPLRAETDLLPAAYGSARICFADGTEAVVGVRAEVERTVHGGAAGHVRMTTQDASREGGRGGASGDDSCVEVAVEMAGQSQQQQQQQRSGGDEESGVFLEQMLREGLLADGALTARLVLGRRWHWRLFIDILLLSPPYTYPLPLLSLTTHLALLNTRLPAPISNLAEDEDPLFNDDWAAAVPLYLPSSPSPQRPPVSVLAIAVGSNIFFDPSREELAVADVVLSITFCSSSSLPPSKSNSGGVKLLAARTVEPPGRRLSAVVGTAEDQAAADGAGAGAGIWKRRAGGVGRDVLRRMVDLVIKKGGVGEEVLDALDGWV